MLSCPYTRVPHKEEMSISSIQDTLIINLYVEEKLYKVFVFLVVRGVVHIWQRVFCQVVYKVLILGVSKSGKENLKGLLGDWM